MPSSLLLKVTVTMASQQDAQQGAPVSPLLTGDSLSNAIEARLIKGFSNEINNLKLEIVSLKSCAPVPRHRLDHPEPLDGPLRWDTWLPLMKAKLRVDSEAIGSKEAQFFYVYSNLESKVQALVLPQLHAAEEGGEYDPQHIIDQLARIYEDPNKIEKATSKLSHIKQGNDSFTIYLARFERLLYEARANKWPAAAQIAALRAGLDSSMNTKLATQLTLPMEYSDFVKVLQRLASQSQPVFRPASSAPTSGHDSHNRGFQKKVGFADKTQSPTEVGAIVPYKPTIAKRPTNGDNEKQLWGMEYKYGEEDLSE